MELKTIKTVMENTQQGLVEGPPPQDEESGKSCQTQTEPDEENSCVTYAPSLFRKVTQTGSIIANMTIELFGSCLVG